MKKTDDTEELIQFLRGKKCSLADYADRIGMLIKMYETGEAPEGLAYVSPEISWIDPRGIVSAALYKCRMLTGRDDLTIPQMFGHRPKRTYGIEDLRYHCNSVLPTCRITEAKDTKCPICGQFDNYHKPRGKLCLDCFCRECHDIIAAANEKGIMMTYADAARWAAAQPFPNDRILTVAAKAHLELSRGSSWARLVAYFLKRSQSLGRWTISPSSI